MSKINKIELKGLKGKININGLEIESDYNKKLYISFYKENFILETENDIRDLNKNDFEICNIEICSEGFIIVIK